MSQPDADSISLPFELSGRRGPGALLIHGSVSTPHIWLAQAAALSSSHRVLVPTLRGHGWADRRGPYDPATHADDIERLCSSEGIEPSLVAGSSMGSGVAIELAVRHPEWVKGLVLVSGFASIGAAGKKVLDLRNHKLRHEPRTAYAELTELVYSKRTRAQHPGLLGMHRAMLDSYPPDHFIALNEAMKSYDVRPLLERLRLPCLLIYGDDDPLVPLDARRELLHGIAGSRLVCVAGAGHLPGVEQPAAVNALLLEFVTSLP